MILLRTSLIKEDKQKAPPAFLLMDGNLKAFPADINNLECPKIPLTTNVSMKIKSLNVDRD